VRIALLSDFPVDPNRIYGGVQAVAYHLARGLAEYVDVDLHVIHSSRAVRADSVSSERRLTVHRLAPPGNPVIPNLVAAVFRCSRVLKGVRPDIANAHTGQYALAALRAGLPTVYTIHGIPHLVLRQVRGAGRRCSGLIQVLFDRIAINRVSAIIAVSPFVETTYRNLTKAGIHPAENLVPDSWFDTVAREIPGRILFVGTALPAKGLHLLIESLSRLGSTFPAAHLHVAGRLDDRRYVARIRCLLDKHRLSDKVRFLGPLDAMALQQEYSECALLALPSLIETAPLAVLEAMAAGRPVIATRVGGLPHLIEDGVTGLLVPPGDAVGLAEGIQRLLSDPALRVRMGSGARAVAHSRFLRDVVVARYRRIYEDVIHSDGLRGRT